MTTQKTTGSGGHGTIEQPWSDAKVILHLREHISNENHEVKPIADYM
jgi:hypothetical protein